ncbi:heme-binding protein soul2 [Neoarius graeffei]|uniref:heme-binding protein soul2 n=1 Tax=Neoarius graeffei TaxID=443677 RepID=UPI00298D32F5|nr:heme-binding protein soul2 [Neoarius graeffei]XP_060782039.1 heme-binding protein soul2 [Neoarius graeffei]
MNLRFCLLFMASLWLGRCWEAPGFCHDYDCPVYTLVKAYESFEERSYAASRWITTDVESTKEDSIRGGIWKLYEFMQGENEEGRKITMTRPVLVSVKNQGNVSISLFISADVVLPQPNDKTIKNKNMPAATVYVREFDGFASETDALENMETLKADLQAAGKPFDDTRFEAVGYDGPFVLINRHNEIWIYAD